MRVNFVVVGRIVRQGCHQQIKQITDAITMIRANRQRLAEIQPPEFHRVELFFLVLSLVDRHKDRLIRKAQDLAHILIGRGQPITPIDNKNNHIGFGDCHLCLILNRFDKID